MTDWKSLRTRLVASYSPKALPPNIQLPVLPDALMKFSEKASDPEADTRELSQIVETDAGLSCDLLRHVNSVVRDTINELTTLSV